MKPKQNSLTLSLDIAGTFVFAIEGAIAAIQANLDLLGIAVLAFGTALGGGIIRDLLIGATPPAALRDWRYPAIAFTGAALTFLFLSFMLSIPSQALATLDAAGLSLFAVAGTEKALEYKIPPFIAPLLGAITATGGGTIRDVLLKHIPAVLRVDFYATAALAGAALLVILRKSGIPPKPAALCGFLFCFLLRLAALRYHWHLPTLAGID